MAFCGHSTTQVLQPSQRCGSMRRLPSGSWVMASKRQCVWQMPQPLQAAGSMLARLPEKKSSRTESWGSRRMCISGASTSRSQRIVSLARAAKAAVKDVLPAPPLPLKTTISRMVALLGVVPGAGDPAERKKGRRRMPAAPVGGYVWYGLSVRATRQAASANTAVIIIRRGEKQAQGGSTGEHKNLLAPGAQCCQASRRFRIPARLASSIFDLISLFLHS